MHLLCLGSGLGITLIGAIGIIVSLHPVSAFPFEEHTLEDSSDVSNNDGCPKNQVLDAKRGCVPQLCPTDLVYYNQTGECLEPKDGLGPCGNLMYLTRTDANFQIGECTCKFEIFGKLNPRPLVHWPQTEECYYIFEQGPCQEGQWIVGGGGKARCEQIPCPAKYKAHSELLSTKTCASNFAIFPHGSNCYTTFSQAFCSEGKLAVFANSSFEPICETLKPFVICYESEDNESQGLSPNNNCPANQTPDLIGGCQQNAAI